MPKQVVYTNIILSHPDNGKRVMFNIDLGDFTLYMDGYARWRFGEDGELLFQVSLCKRGEACFRVKDASKVKIEGGRVTIAGVEHLPFWWEGRLNNDRIRD